jgi:hypothetical protein
VVLDFGARAQDFLKRITTLSPHTAAPAPWPARSLHPNGSRTPGQRPLPPKRHGPGWPSPDAGLPRSSLAPPSASLEKNSPIPPSSLTANWKTRQAPGTSFEPYPIPVLADPKKLVQALDTLRSLKSFPSPQGRNTTTGPQLPKYVSAPSTYPGNPATCEAPTAPSVATSSNPKTRPTISSSPKSSVINSLIQTHPFP